MEFWFHLAFLQPVDSQISINLTPVNSLMSLLLSHFAPLSVRLPF